MYISMHLYKQAPPGAFHNCYYLNNAPPETCNNFSRGALIGSSTVIYFSSFTSFQSLCQRPQGRRLGVLLSAGDRQTLSL